MNFRMIHENYNVADLNASIRFYEEALGLHEARRKTGEDFIIVFMSNEESDFELELTWLADHPQKYDIGEEEFHLAFIRTLTAGTALRNIKNGLFCWGNPSVFTGRIRKPYLQQPLTWTGNMH